MELEVLNIKGEKTGRKIELPNTIFGIEPNNHAIYLDVKRYLAAQRQGTHASKERGYIQGSTRKIKKQKGTGTARAGSIKNPLFRGGGRIFGPTPRQYDLKINKKVKVLARKSALATKAQEGQVMILEDFSFENPKTKHMVALSKDIGLENKKALYVLDNRDENIYLSSRNLQKKSVVTVADLNTYNVMNSGNLIFSESAIKKMEQLLA